MIPDPKGIPHGHDVYHVLCAVISTLIFTILHHEPRLDAHVVKYVEAHGKMPTEIWREVPAEANRHGNL